MPSWGEVQKRIISAPNPLDTTRAEYLKTMNQYTGRNIIAYYSSFMQKPNIEGIGIDDNDKSAFMQAVYGLDRTKGLDLILHTPGGEIAATESIVYYLKKLFDNDIRVFVPQIAMSAGTMIALASKEIVMGKQSNLGPIDPQIGGVSCAGVIEEFKRACRDVKKDHSKAIIWGAIIENYHPTFIGDCEKAIKWSEITTKTWLEDNMYKGYPKSKQKSITSGILENISSHKKTFSHHRHIHYDELKLYGNQPFVNLCRMAFSPRRP